METTLMYTGLTLMALMLIIGIIGVINYSEVLFRIAAVFYVASIVIAVIVTCIHYSNV